MCITVLDRLGGSVALDMVIDAFYKKLVERDEMKIFFKNVNLDWLKQHQGQFMRLAFTKVPEGLDVGNFMFTAHKRLLALGLNETHFDIVASVLVGTLKDDFKVGQEEIDDVVKTVSPLRDVFKSMALRYATERAQEALFLTENY